MNRMRMLVIVIAVLVAGAAVAVVVLRGRTVEAQATAPGPGDDDFAADMKRRPKCWVKVSSSEPGKCPEGIGRVYKGECYMADWPACAEYL